MLGLNQNTWRIFFGSLLRQRRRKPHLRWILCAFFLCFLGCFDNFLDLYSVNLNSTPLKLPQLIIKILTTKTRGRPSILSFDKWQLCTYLFVAPHFRPYFITHCDQVFVLIFDDLHFLGAWWRLENGNVERADFRGREWRWRSEANVEGDSGFVRPIGKEKNGYVSMTSLWLCGPKNTYIQEERKAFRTAINLLRRMRIFLTCAIGKSVTRPDRRKDTLAQCDDGRGVESKY